MSSCIETEEVVEMNDCEDQSADRKAWLSLLSTVPEEHLATKMDAARLTPDYSWLRVPEVGSVMVRGRTGGTGAPFNLGEVTVTRCSLRLASGEVGHGYVQGRSKAHATRVALTDALMQTEAAPMIRGSILGPLKADKEAARRNRAAKAAATKVDFFTLMRGED